MMRGCRKRVHYILTLLSRPFYLSFSTLPTGPLVYPTSPCPKVKEHSSVGDLWMVIRGRVYDFTAFLQGEAGGHPGGAEILAAYAGADGASQHV